jgi:hypothetical protein
VVGPHECNPTKCQASRTSPAGREVYLRSHGVDF